MTDMRKCIAIIGIACPLLISATRAVASECRDPWITQAIREVTGRDPNGDYESGECTYTQYNGGSWSSYQELKGYVQQSLGNNLSVAPGDVPAISQSQYDTLPKSNSNGQIWAYYNGQWMQVIAQGGGNLRLIGQDGASIAINNGAN